MEAFGLSQAAEFRSTPFGFRQLTSGIAMMRLANIMCLPQCARARPVTTESDLAIGALATLARPRNCRD